MTTSTNAHEAIATVEPPAGGPESSQARLVAGVALLALFGLMAGVTRHAIEPLSNPDTWFHLRIGDEFWSDWSITNPGSLSTFATADWVPTQWSTQMLAAAMESQFGLPGVAWLFGFLYLVFICVSYRVLRPYGALLPVAVATSVILVTAGPTLSARPQVLSLVLFTVAAGTWMRAIENRRPPWILVPLTWIWATAHGLWTAGVLLGFVVCLGMLLDRRLSLRHALMFFSVPILSLIAASLTPVGPRLLLSQLAVGERAPLISEWGATSFREGSAVVAALFVAALIVLWSRRHRVVDWTSLLMLMLASAWILTVERLVVFGVILVSPLFVQAATDVIRSSRESYVPSRAETSAVIGSAALFAVALAFAVPHTTRAPAEVPDGFSAALSELPRQAPVLVEDHVGSWIEWKFPHLNPVVDGMFDAYPLSYLEEFESFRSLKPGWPDFIQRSHASAAVLVDGSPLATAMESQLGWRAMHRDHVWVYLVADD